MCRNRALSNYVINPKNATDLCVAGDDCKPWKTTKAGKARVNKLRKRLEEYEAA